MESIGHRSGRHAGYVTQIGHNDNGGCARKGCGKNAQFRVILGGWDVQIYVCSGHVVWAVNLDLISESVGKAMGWRHGYPVPGGIEIRQAMVIPEIGVITRTDFGRDVASQVATRFPAYTEGSDIPHFRPTAN